MTTNLKETALLKKETDRGPKRHHSYIQSTTTSFT